MRILQVNQTDVGGGAHKVAVDLQAAYSRLGHDAWLAVARKRSQDPRVLQIPDAAHRHAWARAWCAAGDALAAQLPNPQQAAQVAKLLGQGVGQPLRVLARKLGAEDQEFPSSTHLLDLPPQRPDVLHLHNLHEGYFDLRALETLSAQVPVVVTLHDTWLLAGHCAYPLGCNRWKTGCGHCPDLSIYPSLARDTTAANWRLRQHVYARSNLQVAAPCQWMLDQVRESMLGPAMREGRVIHYGVDVDVFCPGNRADARRGLNIPETATVVMAGAVGGRSSRFKDFPTLRAAVAALGARWKGREPLIFMALGEAAPPEQLGNAQLHSVAPVQSPVVMAQHLRAADLLLHAAHAEVTPLIILEALACGTPVVATAVGGIPEQVRGLRGAGPHNLNAHEERTATGVLVPPGSATEMASAVEAVLGNAPVLGQLGLNAAADMRARFSGVAQAAAYGDWFGELLARQVPRP